MKGPRTSRPEAPPAGLIGPDAVEVSMRRVKVGETWCETSAMTRWPRAVRHGWLQPLLSYPGAVDVALCVEPYPSELAMNRLRRQLARLESTRRLDEKRSKLSDPELEAAAEDTADLQGRLARGEDRLFRVGLYITARADSEGDLDQEAGKIRSLARSLLLGPSPVTFRALEGWISTLPLGLDALGLKKTFDTSALATAFPFASAELDMSGGVLLGRNATSGGLIFCDRFAHENYNQVLLAESGTGKSYLAKLMVLRSLYQGTEVLVIDPENEYERLARAVDGTVIRLGPYGERLNPLDLWDTTESNPLTDQALFCHTLLSTLLGGTTSEERADLDRAILAAYERAGITSDRRTHSRPAPLLADVVAALSQDDSARSLAKRLERFVSGSHKNLFDAPTTVRPRGQLVVFSLRDLPDELKAPGILLALDTVWRTVRSNQRRRRVVVVDEAWMLLTDRDDSGARFLARLAKSARKYWCGLVTITQNVGDVVSSELGKTVLTNASSQVLLKQSSQAIDAVGDAFRLSEGERSYLRTCPVGHGIYIAGTSRAALEVLGSDEEHELATSDPRELDEMERSA